MWFIGVEVEQETSAPPPKKILDPPLNGQDSSYWIIVSRLLSGKNTFNELMPRLKKRKRKTTFKTKFNK